MAWYDDAWESGKRGLAAIVSKGKSEEAIAQKDAAEKARIANEGLVANFNDFANRRYGDAQQYIREGAAQGAGSVNYGRDRGLEALSGGYNQSRADLRAANSRARSDLAPVASYVGRYGSVADKPVSTYDVVGKQPQRLSDLYASMGTQRNRMSEMFDDTSDPLANFQADPGYEFRRAQGEQALARMGSAGGGRFSGRAAKALADYNQGLASQEYGNFTNRRLALRQQRMGMAGAADQGDLSAMGQRIGAAGGADQMNLAALMDQAGRYDRSSLQNRADQMGLLGRGLDAQTSLAGLAERYGTNQAGLAERYGTNQSNLHMGAANTLAGLSANQGANLSNLAMANVGQNQGLLNILASGNLGGVQYAGGAISGVSQGLADSANNISNFFGGMTGAKAVGGTANNAAGYAYQPEEFKL